VAALPLKPLVNFLNLPWLSLNLQEFHVLNEETITTSQYFLRTPRLTLLRRFVGRAVVVAAEEVALQVGSKVALEAKASLMVVYDPLVEKPPTTLLRESFPTCLLRPSPSPTRKDWVRGLSSR
jgi:hypothetical protein